MSGRSLTIGRGAENDLVLPDPERELSKRHCVIEDQNGNVVVMDFSSNGTFLNYGKLPLGATPTPLNNGDILSIGPYELMIDITAGAAEDQLPDPLADLPVSPGQAAAAPSAADLLDGPGGGGDFLDDLLSGRDGPVGPSGVERPEDGEDGLLPPLAGDEDPLFGPADDPLAGQGASMPMHNPSVQDHFSAPGVSSSQQIPDDWDDDLLSPSAPASMPAPAQVRPPDPPPGDASNPFGSPPPAAAPAAPVIPVEEPVPTPAPVQPAPEPRETPDPVPSQVALNKPPMAEPAPAPQPEAAPQSGSPQDDAAARAFLKALGAADLQIDNKELLPILSRLGHVLRIMIEGTREVLMTRTSIKSEFRIDTTTIRAGGNNPLKFSISPEQAIEAIVKPRAKGYLDATDAAEEAINDVKAHEVATIAGMEAALSGVLKELDPNKLEETFQGKGGLGAAFSSKKARYWDVYKEQYARISDKAENNFHELFSKEFARAYQEQLDKLK